MEGLWTSQFDRHRRLGVPNSILETWSISIGRIRCENRLAYRILYVIAYVDNQNIPFDLMMASSGLVEDEDGPCVLEVRDAVVRLKEFSFISMHQTETDERSFDMHKLVQEATRYGLSMVNMAAKGGDKNDSSKGPLEETEVYFSAIALDAMGTLFPDSERETWAKCEKYLAHSMRVSDWAELCGKLIDTAELLRRISYFLYDRGRWQERQLVDKRGQGMRCDVLGERHPDTIESMADFATTSTRRAGTTKPKKYTSRYWIFGATFSARGI
ncbi:hypothetical protein ACHAQH_008313 [Verticillium albo-atrum]